MRGRVELSVVVPVYNEAGNVGVFLERIVPLLEANVSSYEVIFAADPCTDGTDELIRKQREDNPSVKLLVFSRRFGQPTATLAGIEHATGQAVVVMDVDLQDPPEVVVEMIQRWREGYEVVYGQRRDRTGETRIKKLVARTGYRMINRFAEVPIPRDTGDFRLMDRRVVDELARFPESHGFLRGLVALIGFEQTSVQFDRPARYAGKGNYSQFFGSIRIGLNGIIAFSTALLNLSTLVGVASAALAFVGAIVYLGLKLAGTQFPVGNPTIVFLILFVGGIQLICLGIIGQYIGRIYDDVKRRPRYIVADADGFPSSAASAPPGTSRAQSA